MTSVRLLSLALALGIAIVLITLGGTNSLAYAALFLLATAPGLPLGFVLFGRRHAGSWIAGALLGYAASCLVVWLAIFTHHASTLVFSLLWLTALVLSVGISRVIPLRGKSALVTLPAWTTRDTAALLLVLLLVPILVGRPFARIGSVDENGDKRYRAYFTADFVWHTALTAELKKHDQPPVNPYLAPEPIHYYWTYFLVPAAAGPMAGADVELSLKVNAVGTALLLVASAFLAAWAALPAYAFAVAGALAIVILAASAEGLAAIAYVIQQGQGLGGLRNLNVDALSRGVGGLRIDDLPRAMWYTPQHSMSYALGLAALPVAIVGGLDAGLVAIGIAGLVLGASVAMNPFVGGLLCAVYGLTVLGRWWRLRGPFIPVVRHAVAIVPVLAALGWASINKVAEGAGGTLQFGLTGPAANAPLIAFALSFGPLLPLIVLGLLPQRRVALSDIWPALSGIVLVVLVMHLATMTVDEFWIGFRTGHLFFVLVPAVIVRGLLWLRDQSSRQLAGLVVAAVLLAGLPTTIIDAFNAQDVENTSEGIGLQWTLHLTPEQQAGLAWLRANTPPTAIVQAEPLVRGRDAWSLIPSFAERRMAAGEPISLLHVPDYDSKSDQVQRIYAYPDAKQAWDAARELGIEYLWLDRTDREAYLNTAKFGDHPEFFAPVFTGGDVAIYQVNRDDIAKKSGTR